VSGTLPPLHLTYLVITRDRRVGGTRLAAHGVADGRSLARLEAAVHLAIGDGVQTIDLSAVEASAAGGRALLLNMLRRTRFAHPDLRIVLPDGPFRLAVERTGLDRRMARIAVPLLDASNDTAAVAGLAAARGPRAQPRGATLLRRAALLVEATAAIEAHHADPDLDVNQVARRVATSRRQLQRVFAEFGRTHFRAELTAVRMQHAAELLHGIETVRLIAARVGYRDPAQFTKVFRRHHGLGPAAFRAAVTRASAAAAPSFAGKDTKLYVHLVPPRPSDGRRIPL
jgi:AraC family transcriptional regulator, regulatory protein of adaptative response / methylphosphotriester-DNA alkyltransferase methyltransferase